MNHHLHPDDIIALGKDGLRGLSVRENLKMRDESVDLLIDFAEGSTSQLKDSIQADQFLLRQRLEILEMIEEQIKKLEREIEDLFI